MCAIIYSHIKSTIYRSWVLHFIFLYECLRFCIDTNCTMFIFKWTSVFFWFPLASVASFEERTGKKSLCKLAAYAIPSNWMKRKVNIEMMIQYEFGRLFIQTNTLSDITIVQVTNICNGVFFYKFVYFKWKKILWTLFNQLNWIIFQ